VLHELTAIKRESLPYTRHEDAEQLFDAMAKVEIEEHGFMLTGTSRGGKAARSAALPSSSTISAKTPMSAHAAPR
jgi:hypothetical protein